MKETFTLEEVKGIIADAMFRTSHYANDVDADDTRLILMKVNVSDDLEVEWEWMEIFKTPFILNDKNLKA